MRKSKIILFLIMVIVSIPICVLLSNVIHLSLSNQILEISNINFMTAIQDLFEGGKQLKIYMLLKSLFILFFLAVVFVQKENIYASELGNVTDKIKTPIVAGQGQHGTSRWLTEKEYEKVFDKNIYDVSKTMENQEFKSGGLIVGYKKLKNNNEEIYYIGEDTHSLTIGATRSGKTRTIVLETIGNLGLAGESMILSDPKR